MNKKRLIPLLLLFCSLWLVSCTEKEPGYKESDYTAFLNLLTQNGFQYTEEKPEPDSLLSVSHKPVFVGNEIISVYEYPSNDAMEKDSEYIDKDGFVISNPNGSVTNVCWVSTPHFFKKGTIIINYVGNHELILDLLRGHYGDEFAGNK